MENIRSTTGKQFLFYGQFKNEFDAFSQYYNELLENHRGILTRLIQECNNLKNPCYLYKDIKFDGSNILSSPLKYENPKIAFASRKVDIMNLPEKGRCLKATEEINENEIIISETATILQVNPVCNCFSKPDSAVRRCHNCAKATTSFLMCPNCKLVIFCSNKCRKQSTAKFHEIECVGLRNHFWSKSETDHSYLAMRMLLYGASVKFKTDIDETRYGNNKNNYPYIYILPTNFHKRSIEEINEILYISVRTLTYLKETTQFFHILLIKLGMAGKWRTLRELYVYIGGLLIMHYCQAQINSIKINFYNYSNGFGLNYISGKGKAICPTIALLNHSCTPNAALIYRNDSIEVKTLYKIGKGEEITICYYEVGPFLVIADRHTVTEYLFHFICKCSKCEYEKILTTAKFRCKKCQNGRSKFISDTLQVKCVDCLQKTSSTYYLDNLERISVIEELYEDTNNFYHLLELGELYEKTYHCYYSSVININLIILEIYLRKYCDPSSVIKYACKSFRLLRQTTPKHYLPILMGRLLIYYMLTKDPRFQSITKLKPSEVASYFKALRKIERDLEFYLPKSASEFMTDINETAKALFPNFKTL